MAGDAFETGSLLHIVCLAACGLLSYLAVRLTRSLETRGREHLARRFVGYGCIMAWTMNSAYQLLPERFGWENSLPLHFCNFANLLGAAAVLTRRRLFQSLLYFWTLGLSIWAFLTPTVTEGPNHLGFWVFWTYHFFILLGLVFVLVIDGFAPRVADLKWAILITASYTALLIPIDYALGWNYGFLGQGSPSQPTPIDVLGPYPYRIVYLVVGVAIFFSLLLLPWAIARARVGNGFNDGAPEESD